MEGYRDCASCRTPEEIEERMKTYPNHRLVASSSLFLVTSALAARLGLYVSSALVFTLFVTSFLYWWRPAPGLRRNVDIAAAAACYTYQLALSFKSSTQVSYIAMNALGVLSYVTSNSMVDTDTASWFHVGLHVMGNMSNVVLYIGIT